MPELPEVERARRLAESVARGRLVVAAQVEDDRIVLDGVSPVIVRRALVDRRVLAVHRRGKVLWLELDRPPHPLIHLGMTGSVCSPGAARLQLATGPSADEDAWPPRFTKLRLEFDDGGQLAVTNARRLGRIRLRDEPPHEPPISTLGWDPLTDPLEGLDVDEAFASRRCAKAILLDQAIMAGVGNWIADEALHRAHIAPMRPGASLTPAERRRLRRAVRDVVVRAAAVDADSARYPRSWLFHRRWRRKELTRAGDGDRFERIVVAGRPTLWSPERQV